MTKTWDLVTTTAAVGSGLMGGVFFAFSGFVMSGLTRLPGAQGLAAMNSINVTAQRPPLMIGLFGTAALCVAAGVHALREPDGRRTLLVVIGAGVYLIGVVVTTMVFNVPINNRMADLAPTAVDQWRHDARLWTLGNHLRTLAGAAAAVLFTVAQRTPAAAATMAAWRG